MSEDGGRLKRITEALSVSALGYVFLDNPDGFVVAVLLDEITDWIEEITAAVASSIANSMMILTTAIVDGLSVIVSPADLIGDAILDLVDVVEGAGVFLAMRLGPFGFLAIPISTAIVAAATTLSIIAIWRLYKWIRTVLV